LDVASVPPASILPRAHSASAPSPCARRRAPPSAPAPAPRRSSTTTAELAAALTLAPGPVAAGREARYPVTLSRAGGAAQTEDLVVEQRLGREELAAVATGPLVFPGEIAATARGVLDALQATPYYQGPPGPMSNARYVALDAPGRRRFVLCQLVDDAGQPLGSERELIEREVTVYDRFAGTKLETKAFSPEAPCDGPARATGIVSLGVPPEPIRAWLAATFVK